MRRMHGDATIFSAAGPGTEYRIDPQTLLAQPLDAAVMRSAALALLDAPAATPETAAARASRIGTAGWLLAMCGDAARGEALLRGLLDEPLPPRQHAVLWLRLAQALQALGRHADAVAAARRGLQVVQSAPEAAGLLDFALHHLGKALLDAGDIAAARDALQQALRLREQRGDAALIESTRLALAALERAAAR